MKLLIYIIGPLLVFTSHGQVNRENALLIAEFEKDSDVGDFTHLVSYNFIDGVFTSKDTILSASVSKGQYQGSYVRYDLGTNFIYQNRYIISGTGNVIDYFTRSLVIEESDEIVELRGDSIIFHRDNIFTGTGYLVCDLENRTYGFVEDSTFMAVEGYHSPNHKFGLMVDYSSLPRRIILFDENNRQKIIVSDCGFGSPLKAISSSSSRVPVYWLDNQTFLYVKFYSESRRRDRAEVIKVDISSGRDEVVATIDTVRSSISNFKFRKTRAGKVVLAGSSYRELEFDAQAANHQFDIFMHKDFSLSISNDSCFFKFKGNEIGSRNCGSMSSSTDGFIATKYWSGDRHRCDGVRVWNNITAEWTDLEIYWTAAIIGWIEN
ncbi:hypothetical protein JYT74_01200 [Crocinitomix catalasitica]|nr:hypothetical protein [Crocinitomix catalasitica]